MGQLRAGLREQAAGKFVPWNEIETIPAAQLRNDYPDTTFGKHAAWRDNDWKLHRIEARTGAVKWELYHLAAEPPRAAKMRGELEDWLKGVDASLNPNSEMERPRKGAKPGFRQDNGPGGYFPASIHPGSGSFGFFAPFRG